MYKRQLKEELKILNSNFYRDSEAGEEDPEDWPLMYHMEGESHSRMHHFINLHLAETVIRTRFGFNMDESLELDTKYFVRQREDKIEKNELSEKVVNSLDELIYEPEIGSIWLRLLAYFLDIIPTTIIAFILCKWWYGYDSVIALKLSENALDIEAYNHLKVVVRYTSIVLWLIYGTFMDYRYQGTHGKIICGLKVVDHEGNNPTLRLAVERNSSKLISEVFLYLGFIWIAIDKKAKGWHDHISNTLVVRRK